ncbi:MAG TPA: hypothetical protein VFP83_08000 [Candidatus Limnocylindria bacterium]|nr:hypothetical protein [Candidatus Limnocylindria bacterium]
MKTNASPLPAPDRPVLNVVEDRIIVSHLELTDAGLAGYVAGVPEPERPGLAVNALRVGLQALAHAGTGANVDLVRSEFGRMVEQMAATQARAAEALDASLRATFADGEGKLPRTLEDFLGDSGKLQRLTGALFDPNRRDSAIGQLNDMLGRYFDGDGSRLAQLLDPTREASPLYQFRNEVSGEFRSLGERIAALEAASRARADERARGTAKGVEFEDAVEAGLAELARGVGDFLERTGTEAGDALRSKKGDFVLTIDPSRTSGRELRVVIEAKDRSLSRRVLAEELTAARANRGAAIALAVFTPEHAPAGVSPFALVGSDVYAVYDPEADGGVGLEAAFRVARVMALLTLRETGGQVDVAAIGEALQDVQFAVDNVRKMKARLTNIGSAAQEISALLDEMRERVLGSVRDIDDLVRAVEPTSGEQLPLSA